MVGSGMETIKELLGSLGGTYQLCGTGRKGK